MSYGDATDTVTLTISNIAAGDQPQIETGVSATLAVVLTNSTGGDITLVGGGESTASSIEVYMPDVFTSEEVAAIKIDGVSPPGWSYTYDSQYRGQLLTFTGEETVWASGTTLTFNLTNVETQISSTLASVTVNLDNLMGDNVPGSIEQPLSIVSQSQPTSVDLTEVLAVSLDNQGAVFVSVADDPLTNTLSLNLKNVSDHPVYDDETPWQGNPKVTVSFVYGNTAGALAPDDNSPGNAWPISVSVDTDTGSGWGYGNPQGTVSNSCPVWTLTPNSDNKDILGAGTGADAGADANVTFTFSNVQSFTLPGHTQMYVQFDGFRANSTTPYKPALFVLDIVKTSPPLTRGAVSFFGTNDSSIITLAEAQKDIELPLKWCLYYVDKIAVICNVPGVPPIEIDYFNQSDPHQIEPVKYGNASIKLPMVITQNTPVFITLQAFDNLGNYLNAMQYTYFISADFFVDQAGQSYPTVFLNGQTWLAKNFDLAVSGSTSYEDNDAYRGEYGLLYTADAAQTNTPAGWRLPTQEDWEGLIEAAGGGAAAYDVLSSSTGFHAVAGGMGDGAGGFSGMATTGYYWSATANNQSPGTCFIVTVFPDHTSIKASNSSAKTNPLSVRYVKNT